MCLLACYKGYKDGLQPETLADGNRLVKQNQPVSKIETKPDTNLRAACLCACEEFYVPGVHGVIQVSCRKRTKNLAHSNALIHRQTHRSYPVSFKIHKSSMCCKSRDLQSCGAYG
jgi:hypothetical protein